MARSKRQADPPAVRVFDDERPIADLIADPQNARRHSEGQIAQIVESIGQFGYVNKVVIRPDGMIIGGHATLDAIKRIGGFVPDGGKLPVRVVEGLTPTQYAKLALALNRIPENSTWDDGLLRDVLAGIRDEGEDVLDVGFSSGEVDKLLAEPADIEVQSIDTAPVDDEFWISIRGQLKDQAAALQALQAALKSYRDVTVELGTINLG